MAFNAGSAIGICFAVLVGIIIIVYIKILIKYTQIVLIMLLSGLQVVSTSTEVVVERFGKYYKTVLK